MSKVLTVRLFRGENVETVFIDNKKVATNFEGLFFDQVMDTVAEAITKEDPDKVVYERYWSDFYIVDEEWYREDPDFPSSEISVSTLEDYLEYSEKVEEPFDY